MNLVKKISFLFFLTLFLSGSLKAAELIMVEQQGCYYCLEWKDQLGHIYPKTPEGKFAPLKTIDITEVDKIEGLKRDVIFTPTFVSGSNTTLKTKPLGKLSFGTGKGDDSKTALIADLFAIRKFPEAFCG